MSLWAKVSLVTTLTLLVSVFMYQGWYKPVPTQAAISNPTAWTQLIAQVGYPAGSVGNFTVNAGANRLLVVAIASTRTAVGNQTVTNVTWNGQPMTLAAGDAATTTTWNHTYLYYLKDANMPATTTTAAVNVTITGGTAYYNTVHAAVYAGVDQVSTNPFTAAVNYNSGATADATVGPTNLTIAANDQAIQVVNLARSATGTTARTMLTWDAANPAGWTTAGAASAAIATSGPCFQSYVRDRNLLTATTDTSTHTATGNSWDSISAMSVKAAAVDTTPPTVTINQAAGQSDPASASPINFTVVFSEATTNFATGDVTISGSAGGTKTATVTGSGTNYNVAVSGMTTAGTVVATIGAGVATDAAGNGNTASTSTDNSVSWTVADTTPPTVTINQAAAQADPTSTSPINFTVVFSEATTNFATGDVTIGGTAGGTKTATVTGSGTTYNVAVTGMTTAGTVTATVPLGVATDAAGNGNTASTSTDNSVSWTVADTTPPTVTINQAAAQADPTSTSPINFTVVFSEATTNFATGDVTITGTAGGTKTATVTGSGTTYNVAVTGMTTAGTVVASIGAGVATDAAGNGNTASTSTDASVGWTVSVVPGTIALSSATYSVGEADGTVTITASRTVGSAGAVGISYATSAGTATAGSDYTTATGTLSWAAGDSADKTFTVAIINDVVVESNETFNVTLSAPTGGATLGTSSAVVTIIDNDGAVVSPLMHNSINIPGTKGTWGTTFNCATCHNSTTTNIKRIAPQVNTPNGLRNVVFTRMTANPVTGNAVQGVFGNDARTYLPTASNNVCSVCHHKTVHHQYSTTSTYAGYTKTHYNNEDCTSCHKHSAAFAKSGVAHVVPYPGATHMSAAGTSPWPTCSCHTGAAVMTYTVWATNFRNTAPNCTTCHLNGLGVPSGGSSCVDCHGASATDGRPSGTTFPNINGSHSVAGHVLVCSTCHNNAGTGTPNHGNSGGTTRTAADVTVSFASGVGTWNGTACSATYCHGGATVTWGATLPGTVAGCDKCHSAVAGATFMLTDRTTTTAKSVVHVSHLNRSHSMTSAGMACTACHASYASASAIGHNDSALPADVVMATGTFNGTQCLNTYCHGTTLKGNNSPYTAPASVVLSPTFGTTLLNGTPSNDCGKCHGYPPATPVHNLKVPTDCKNCHKHVNAAGTGFETTGVETIALHMNGIVEGGTCYSCHREPVGKRRLAITGQFTSSRNSHHYQGATITDATAGKVCYACHWEADSTGSATTHHQETTAGFTNKVQLVVWGTSTVRPTTYAAANYVLYSSGGKLASTRAELTKINTHCLGCHNDTNRTTAPFTGDTGTPAKYSWEAQPANKGGLAGVAQSIAVKYTDLLTTNWGKFSGNFTNSKSSLIKAFSGHGNAQNNARGWSTIKESPQATTVVANYTNTSGSAATSNVLCFDCHNSHGSEAGTPANAITTSYSSATGKGRGGILKETTAGFGGYAVTYRPYSGGNFAQKNVYKAGAGLCFDCHNNSASVVTSTGSTSPWGYGTFGATQIIHGYNDNPYFGKVGGVFARGLTYPYIGTGKPNNAGGHFGASSNLSTATVNNMKIGGLCTPCHDPHGVSPLIPGGKAYAVPMLKDTFVTSPYKMDSAALNGPVRGGGRNFAAPGLATIVATPGYHIDQNTMQTASTGSPAAALRWAFATTATSLNTLTDVQFAGLCMKCHSKASLNSTAAVEAATGTGAGAWMKMTRIHNAVEGWALTTGSGGNLNNKTHAYTCSKCHSTHNSNLPRLLITNCLDVKHKNEAQSGGTVTSVSGSVSTGNGLGRFPGGGARATGSSPSSPGPWFFGTDGTAATQPCHDALSAGGTTFNATSQQWNTKSQW
jgi:predicted CxxxxCH...CXXCH cytochrome family protein